MENLLRLERIAPEHPGHDHIPVLLDHFQHKGPNGTHSCLVFEVLGEGIGWFCRRMFPNRHLPPTLDKMVVQQLITVLDFLHNICGFVHTGRILLFLQFAHILIDISSTNVLIAVSGLKSSDSAEQLLQAHPGWPSSGAWAGGQPTISYANGASREVLEIPGTDDVRLMDSEAILSFESLTEHDYPDFKIKLVGLGHGTLCSDI